MDARTEELKEGIREKRIAIDNRLELIRLKLQRRDPRHALRQRWPMLAGAAGALLAGLWLIRRRRDRRRESRGAAHGVLLAARDRSGRPYLLPASGSC